MGAHLEAKKILKGLSFNFAAFTMGEFLQVVGQSKGREIITIPWDMPLTLFGAWISDGDEPREYIFYRNNVSEIHQIHIQLHEISHFLFGHPTLQINRQTIVSVVAGKVSLPFAELPQLRSPKLADFEKEAETLADLIQKQIIHHAQIDGLIRDISPEKKFAHFLKIVGHT